MKLEILHNLRGDREKDVDTSTPEGRQEAADLFAKLLKQGTAIFLERPTVSGTETFRVTGYDKETDRLIVQLPDEVKPDESMEVEPATPRRRGRRARTPARQSDRVTACAPVSGGLPGPVSDSYDPEFGTGERARVVASAIRDVIPALDGILKSGRKNIVDVAYGSPGETMNLSLSEREWRLIRFSLYRALESI